MKYFWIFYRFIFWSEIVFLEKILPVLDKINLMKNQVLERPNRFISSLFFPIFAQPRIWTNVPVWINFPSSQKWISSFRLGVAFRDSPICEFKILSLLKSLRVSFSLVDKLVISQHSIVFMKIMKSLHGLCEHFRQNGRTKKHFPTRF